MRGIPDLPIVTRRIGLDACEVALAESRWKGILSQQQLIGAVDILDARPNRVAQCEFESRLEQIRVADISIRQALVAAPQKQGGPVAITDWPVIADRSRHAADIFVGLECFGT